MCQHSKVIYNRYLRKYVRVDCGHCPACLQKRAMSRATRIRNNLQSGEIALFVTLTYKNDYVPYIRVSDLVTLLESPISSVRLEDNRFKLPVYRDSFCYYTRSGNLVQVPMPELCQFKYFSESEYKLLSKLHRDGKLSLTHGNKMVSDKVTVHCFNDIQNFFKRLRQNLFRRYNYDKSFNYFACVEYGPSSKRTHSHLLLFIPKAYESLFRKVIVESWPYQDRNRSNRCVEVARDASSYVASYVNSVSGIHPFYSAHDFRNKHSMSQDFGVRSACFKLASILEKVRSGSLFYSVTKVTGSGVWSFNPVIPKYVINRHFPKFKGYSRLSLSEVAFILQDPQRLRGFATELGYESSCVGMKYVNRNCFGDDCSSKLLVKKFTDVERTIVMLENAYQRYSRVTAASRIDFAYDFLNTWNCFSSTVLKSSYVNPDGSPVCDFRNHYEDLPGESLLRSWAPTLNDIPYTEFQFDSNKTRCRIRDENIYVPLYFKMNKERKVVNHIMSAMLNIDV